jgi:hypothetical protein
LKGKELRDLINVVTLRKEKLEKKKNTEAAAQANEALLFYNYVLGMNTSPDKLEQKAEQNIVWDETYGSESLTDLDSCKLIIGRMRTTCENTECKVCSKDDIACVYCKCRVCFFAGGAPRIECAICDTPYHEKCVASVKRTPASDEWFCGLCVKEIKDAIALEEISNNSNTPLATAENPTDTMSHWELEVHQELKAVADFMSKAQDIVVEISSKEEELLKEKMQIETAMVKITYKIGCTEIRILDATQCKDFACAADMQSRNSGYDNERVELQNRLDNVHAKKMELAYEKAQWHEMIKVRFENVVKWLSDLKVSKELIGRESYTQGGNENLEQSLKLAEEEKALATELDEIMREEKAVQAEWDNLERLIVEESPNLYNAQKETRYVLFETHRNRFINVIHHFFFCQFMIQNRRQLDACQRELEELRKVLAEKEKEFRRLEGDLKENDLRISKRRAEPHIETRSMGVEKKEKDVKARRIVYEQANGHFNEKRKLHFSAFQQKSEDFQGTIKVLEILEQEVFLVKSLKPVMEEIFNFDFLGDLKTVDSGLLELEVLQVDTNEQLDSIMTARCFHNGMLTMLDERLKQLADEFQEAQKEKDYNRMGLIDNEIYDLEVNKTKCELLLSGFEGRLNHTLKEQLRIQDALAIKRKEAHILAEISKGAKMESIGATLDRLNQLKEQTQTIQNDAHFQAMAISIRGMADKCFENAIRIEQKIRGMKVTATDDSGSGAVKRDDTDDTAEVTIIQLDKSLESNDVDAPRDDETSIGWGSEDDGDTAKPVAPHGHLHDDGLSVDPIDDAGSGIPKESIHIAAGGSNAVASDEKNFADMEVFSKQEEDVPQNYDPSSISICSAHVQDAELVSLLLQFQLAAALHQDTSSILSETDNASNGPPPEDDTVLP